MSVLAKGGVKQGLDDLRIDFGERNDAGQIVDLVYQEKRALLRFGPKVEPHRLQLHD